MSSEAKPRHWGIVLALRVASLFVTVAGLGISVVLLKQRSSNAYGGQSIDMTWNYLPVIGLGISIVWTLFSILVLGSGVMYWLPKRLHLSLDVASAVAMMGLGYTGFAYDTIKYWSTGLASQREQDIEAAGVSLLSVAAIMHFVFFIHGCRKASSERQAEVAPPTYVQSENPFDDAKSTRSLPEYTAASEKVSMEKKDGVVVTEKEFV